MPESGESFERRIAPYRPEVLAHCYRMLGSVHDAEDLVQETFLRAWRAREQYDASRSALRTWLYRIATNVCLTALQGRSRRPLPAVQHLSARQRAALILREVLDFSAVETAEILSTTTASVNSSLQRARARARLGEAGIRAEQVAEPSEAEQRAWVDRYMKAFEQADVEGLKRLLTEDVVMEMYPMVNWFTGRENYGVFMDWVFAENGVEWRFRPVGANAQPAFAAYNRTPGGAFQLHTLQVFTVTRYGISRTSVFRDAEVFASFDFPEFLPPAR